MGATAVTDDHDLRKTAERRADMKLAFRSHLLSYVIVNAGLVAINLTTSPEHLWFVWPMVGWGIGLVAHGAATYGFVNADRETLIQKEMDRLRSTRNP